MNEALFFLAPPMAMCLVLVGIHCYLGLHVLERGVIFVDLALAQVAAFGSILALILDYEHSDRETYLLSLAMTLATALFLALAGTLAKRISQEAIIGIIYAGASASVVLLIDKLSHGAEHLKYALVGQLLWVTWDQVFKVLLIYTAVALIHYLFRKPLIAQTLGLRNDWKWDFLFYALFGIVITSSVHVAGVLLVFSFLIVPAVLSAFFFEGIRKRLFFGWATGIVLSFLGLATSYWLDMPAGAFIVVLFAVTPLIVVLFSRWLPKNNVS